MFHDPYFLRRYRFHDSVVAGDRAKKAYDPGDFGDMPASWLDEFPTTEGPAPLSLVTRADYVLYGSKWGDSGTLGTPGGIVTWSISAAGNADGSSENWFTGNTLSMATVFSSFDYTTALNDAFAAWSSVANIQFVQVADGGGAMGDGFAGHIRIGTGVMDGAGNTLASAYSPSSGGNSYLSSLAGDVMFDSSEGAFWTYSSFLAVATHEIGHSLGLDHTNVSRSLMNPTYNPAVTTPQADDIAGI